MKIVFDGMFAASQRKLIRNETLGKYLKASVHVTDLHGDTPSVTMKIQTKDGLGNFVDVLVDTAVTTVSSSTLEIGWDLASAPNAVLKAHVLDTYYLFIDHADAKDVSYTATVEYGR